MPSEAHAGAAQEAPDIRQWEGQDVPLVRPSSCNVKGGIPSSRTYLPTYLGRGPSAMHRLTAWGQWAVDLLQYTASLPGGSGQWTSCNTRPHCLRAVGSGPPATHCLTAWGQSAVDLLLYTAPQPGGSVQWTSCNALPHCMGAVGSGQWTSCNIPPHCLGVVGSGPPAIHSPTAWGQWAVDLLQCTASLPRGSGQ